MIINSVLLFFRFDSGWSQRLSKPTQKKRRKHKMRFSNNKRTLGYFSCKNAPHRSRSTQIVYSTKVMPSPCGLRKISLSLKIFTEHGYISFICFINRRLGPKNASRGYWNTIRAVFFRKLVVGRSSLKIFMRYWHHVPYQCVLTFIANFCIFYMRLKPKGVSSTMFFTSNDKNSYLRMWIFFTFDMENVLPFLQGKFNQN